MTRRLSVIGAPSSAAGYAPGQERAPEALRQRGLLGALRQRGFDVRDAGDTRAFRWRPDPGTPAAANVGTVAEVAREVADRVVEAISDWADAVLILGGDCTVGVGTVAGLTGSGERVGLVYLDGDVDLNVPATGDGPLDWMGVAHLLDVEGAEDALAGIGPARPLLAPDQVLFVAPSNITPPEQALIDRLQLTVMPLEDVVADLDLAARRITDWATGFDRIAVHLDADVLAFIDLPVAEGSYRRPGLSQAGLQAVLAAACATPGWCALTVSEVNPDHWPDGSVGDRFVALLADAMAAAVRRD